MTYINTVGIQIPYKFGIGMVEMCPIVNGFDFESFLKSRLFVQISDIYRFCIKWNMAYESRTEKMSKIQINAIVLLLVNNKLEITCK